MLILFQTRLMNQRKLKACVLVNGSGGAAMPAIYASASDCFIQVTLILNQIYALRKIVSLFLIK